MENQEHTSEKPGKDHLRPQRSQSWWQLLIQNFPVRQFILGALIPLMIFYIFKSFGQPLAGALLAGSWGLGVVLVVYWRTRRIELFAGLATTLAVIELVTTAITRSPAFFLASASIDSAAYGFIFLSSLLFSRPVLQLMAEETVGIETFSGNLRRSPPYRTAWQILTTVWGGVYLCKAILLVLLQLRLPLEVFLVFRTLLGWPVWAILFSFSFWFPGWYWRRVRVIRDVQA